MDWTDQAILLSLRRHGESSAVVSVLTREHGRHAGLVRGGTSKTARGSLQTGNRLMVTWKARLAEHLGNFTWEPLAATGTLWLHDACRLAAIASACALAEATLPEREDHPAAYEGLLALLETLGAEDWASLYVHWEIGLLGELGYGLDLTCCAATGATTDLVYLSPRTGRAVSQKAGEPFHDKLLPLPKFLLGRSPGSPSELMAALKITAHFFDRHVLGPHGHSLPPARARLLERLS